MAQDRTISLETLYNAEAGPAFMTGIQALVRLPLMQRRLDRRQGLKTAGLISGYRGSPLGAYDQQLWRAQDFLDAHDVLFQPGLNEDLAATALWGAQMHKAYEVARLYCDPAFRQALEAQFSRTGKLHLYLAPPLISRIDKTTGRPAKRKFGPWIFYFFSLLSKFRGLRGTWADPFGRTSERRNERRLASEYTELIEALSQDLCSASIDRALELAQLPDIIRGFGPVKEEAMARYEERRATLLEVPEMRAREKAA